jgi:hypothetical protein
LAARPAPPGRQVDPFGELRKQAQLPPSLLPVNLRPLADKIAMLWIDDQLDRLVAAPRSGQLSIRWAVPRSSGDELYLRIGNRAFAPDSCPAAATTDVGDALLAATDGFDHPLRRRYPADLNAVGAPSLPWSVSEPPLPVGVSYYVQGCVANRGRYTGESTNTVVVEMVSSLPDLYIKELRMLGGSELGRLFIAVDDLNWRESPIVRGDSIAYALFANSHAPDSGSSTGPTLTANGTAPLARGAWSWIVTDFRVPDDGRFYRVSVRVNPERAVPETDYANNASYLEDLRTRPHPALFVLERVEVDEDCDGVSRGDWFFNFGLFQGDHCWPFETWPPFDIGDGAAHDSNIAVRLADVDPDALLNMYFQAWDCDGLFAGCGEEFPEAGGSNDFAGEIRRSFSGADRAGGLSIDASSSRGTCGGEAYRMRFRYMDDAAPEAERYRVVGTYDWRPSSECPSVPP